MSTPVQFVLPLKADYYGRFPIGTYLDISIDDLVGTFEVVGTANHGTVLVVEKLKDAVHFPEEALKFKIPDSRVNPQDGDNQ